MLAPQFAFAYDHRLSDDTVREAYFIGQDKTSMNSFLAQYTLALPLPPTGPHVSEVELSTPMLGRLLGSAWGQRSRAGLAELPAKNLCRISA